MNPFHPELRFSAALFRFFPPLGLVRKLLGMRRAPRPPRLPGLAIYDKYVFALDGQPLRMRVYRRVGATEKRPGLLWIHGGGYVMGSPELDERGSIEIARRLGITVVAVSYRVAPSWPFPTPLEDCYAALCWLHREADELGVDPTRLAVGGASAGGGLAAALAQLAHDRQQVPLEFQLLIYPMLDDRTALRTDIEHRKLRLWTHDNNRYGWTAYLGQAPGQPDVRPYAVPARRVNLEQLPPAWIGTGDCDLFCTEDVAYAGRLCAAGVRCELRVVAGAYHGFDIVRPKTRVAQAFRAAYLAALGRGLGLNELASSENQNLQ